MNTELPESPLTTSPPTAPAPRMIFNLTFENDGHFPNMEQTQKEMREWLGDPELHLYSLSYSCDFCHKTFPRETLVNYTCLECARYWDICAECSAHGAQAEGCPEWMVTQAKSTNADAATPFATGTPPSPTVVRRAMQLLTRAKHDVQLYQRLLEANASIMDQVRNETLRT